MSLPLRLRQKLDEPGHGALLRLCARTGRSVVSSFAASIDIQLRSALAGHDVQRVADLSGLKASPLAWWSPMISVADRVVVVAGEELALGDWSITTRRHCPECLREDVAEAAAASVPPDWLASHRSWWDVRSIAACPHHGVRLVDSCHSCGSPLGWRDARRLSCPCCGADLVSGAEPLFDPLGGYVAARLGIGTCARPVMLEELPLRRAISLCGKLGRAGLGAKASQATAGVPSLEIGAEGLRRAALGERGLDDVFERAIANRRADAPEGLGGTYGWLHNEWLGTDDPANELLRGALRRHAVANGVMAEDEDRLGSAPPPTMSLTRAAAEAGVAFERMRRMLDDADAIPSGSRRGVAFALDPITVVAISARPRGSLRRAAWEILGVRRTASAGLVEAGHLDVTDEAAFRASADRLMTSIGRQLCAGAAPVEATALPTATVAASVPLARVVGAVLQGCLPAWWADEGVGLASVMVRPVDLLPLRARPDGFSGVNAARSLGLHQDCVRVLVREEVLDRGPDGLIPHAAIERFRSRYVSGGELARARGWSPGRLIRRLAEQGIQPVWPLATHRQAIFLRADLLGHELRGD